VTALPTKTGSEDGDKMAVCQLTATQTHISCSAGVSPEALHTHPTPDRPGPRINLAKTAEGVGETPQRFPDAPCEAARRVEAISLGSIVLDKGLWNQ
jgi:hypothetical protein